MVVQTCNEDGCRQRRPNALHFQHTYQVSLYAVPVVTAEYRTFENVAVFLHGQGIKSLFAVIYPPGSSPATSIFIDEFAEFLGQFTRYCHYG